MSQENVEVVRQSIGLLAGQDVVAWFDDANEEDLQQLVEAVYSPDITIRWLESNPDQRLYEGRSEVPAAFLDWIDAWDTFVFEPEEFIDGGDHVLVPNTQHGTGKGSSVEISMTTTIVVTVRDGQIARLREFESHSEALEAAGLSE
jgi:ketosteroid isomerase-like protein